jgi:SEC-C motif
MNQKIGRNEPCHCGSGKKFKHCHALLSSRDEPAAIQTAVPMALAWLNKYHRKGFGETISSILELVIAELFDGDIDAGFEAIAKLPPEILEQLNINLTEFALASGQIEIKDTFVDVSEVLLGQNGPRLDPSQRDWMLQLSTQPLCLYDVTQVEGGQGLTVCEALENVTPPIRVTERAASQFLHAGEQIAARVMRQEDEFVFSGAVYRYSMLAGRELLDELRAERVSPDIHPEDMSYYNATTILECWLSQYLFEPQMPTVIDQYSGDPMLFVTDFYDVADKKALSQILVCNWLRRVTAANGPLQFYKKQAAVESVLSNPRAGETRQAMVRASRGRSGAF